MVWLAINLISNGNSIQGAGVGMSSSHLALAMHSPWKLWYCLVEPFNVLECQTLITLTVRAEDVKTIASVLSPFFCQPDRGHGYLIHINSYITGFAESMYIFYSVIHVLCWNTHHCVLSFSGGCKQSNSIGSGSWSRVGSPTPPPPCHPLPPHHWVVCMVFCSLHNLLEELL